MILLHHKIVSTNTKTRLYLLFQRIHPCDLDVLSQSQSNLRGLGSLISQMMLSVTKMLVRTDQGPLWARPEKCPRSPKSHFTSKFPSVSHLMVVQNSDRPRKEVDRGVTKTKSTLEHFSGRSYTPMQPFRTAQHTPGITSSDISDPTTRT